MQRWHLTVGLSAAALAAAALAPRLAPSLPVPEPAPEAQAISSGALHVDVGLDVTALPNHGVAERFLVVHVWAPDGTAASTRQAVDVGVVLDTSGSMAVQGKMDFAKHAARQVPERMHATDSFALVTFSDHARVVLPATRNPDPAAVALALDQIYEGGGTNLYAGLELGAEQVRRSGHAARVGRVVILSDGKANAGVVEPAAFTQYAARLTEQGVTVSTVGLGLDFNEDLLASIADVGGGSYRFADVPSELDHLFADELEAARNVVARQTNLLISTPPAITSLEVLGWPATPTPEGWSVYLGDLRAGDHRKVVAKVRVNVDQVDRAPLAQVRADFHDIVQGQPGMAQAPVSATVATNPTSIDASLDRKRWLEARRALGHWYADRATRAYAAEDHESARALLREGRAVLRDAAGEVGAPELQPVRKALLELGYSQDRHTPDSAEGRRMIKRNKERFRVLSR